MMFVVGLGFGALIGCIIVMVVSQIKSVGSLRIDLSDPDDNPYLFLELTKGVDVIYRKKHITLKVNIENYISHK